MYPQRRPAFGKPPQFSPHMQRTQRIAVPQPPFHMQRIAEDPQPSDRMQRIAQWVETTKAIPQSPVDASPSPTLTPPSTPLPTTTPTTTPAPAPARPVKPAPAANVSDTYARIAAAARTKAVEDSTLAWRTVPREDIKCRCVHDGKGTGQSNGQNKGNGMGNGKCGFCVKGKDRINGNVRRNAPVPKYYPKGKGNGNGKGKGKGKTADFNTLRNGMPAGVTRWDEMAEWDLMERKYAV